MAGAVWRQRDFALLWAGQTVSEVGSQVTVLALPTLAIIGFHASPAAVGLLVASERIPFPVLSLYAGAVVDRLRRRPLMILCCLARLLILAAIPVLDVLGDLRLWQLFVATTAMGVFTVFFDIAYLAYIPRLVGPEALLEANSRLEVSMSAASLAGPGLGGLLVQAFGAARAVLVDGLSFLVAVGALLAIRTPEPVVMPDAGRRIHAEIAEGVRHVFSNTVLRSQLLCMGAAGIFAHGLEAPLYVYAYNHLHLSPGLLGFVLTAQGLGALAASFVATAVTGRIGVGPTIAILDAIAIGVSGLVPLAGLASPVLVLLPIFVVAGAAGTIGNIAQVTLRQSLSPARLQGRMTAVFRTVFWGAWPLGNLLGGFAAGSVGPAATLIGGAVLGATINLTIVFTPLWRVRSFDPVPVG